MAKLYQGRVIPLFYLPMYKGFIDQELAADKAQEGSKIQFVQVFPSFIEHCMKIASDEDAGSTQLNPHH